MWRPGFPYLEQQRAILHGYHRAFCIFSHYYRGTPDHPGLVLGLDHGGFCAGAAFRVSPENWEDVVEYLNDRELIGYPYTPCVVSIEIDGNTVPAYTFVADRDHALYAGDMEIESAAEIIMSASGAMGLNRDYVLNTISELEDQGFQEERQHDLLKRIEELTASLSSAKRVNL